MIWTYSHLNQPGAARGCASSSLSSLPAWTGDILSLRNVPLWLLVRRDAAFALPRACRLKPLCCWASCRGVQAHQAMWSAVCHWAGMGNSFYSEYRFTTQATSGELPTRPRIGIALPPKLPPPLLPVMAAMLHPKASANGLITCQLAAMTLARGKSKAGKNYRDTPAALGCRCSPLTGFHVRVVLS